MSSGILLAMLCCVTLSHVHAQEQSKYQFSLLRQDDNLEAILEADDKSFYDRIKVVQVGGNNTLSFGGSYRDQFELFNNEEFSFSPNRENGWFLRRFLLHSDLKIGNGFRVFGELGSSLISGKEIRSPVDKDQLYVNQLFAEFAIGAIKVTAGRENLKVGSRRLIDPREGPNVRQAFDHLSAEWSNGEQSLLIFAGSPVVPQTGVFDNRDFQNDEWLWGVYGEKLRAGNFNVDGYYLGTHYASSVYELGTEEELRHSMGVRIWKTLGKWQFDNEAVFQIGTFGNRDILAWTISFDIKNQLSEQHSLGIKSELISGTSNEGTLGTFNPLYPRGAYFGRVARFGPANLIDVHPYWNFRTGKFSMEIDYDVFWRFSLEDAVYGPPLNIVLEGESNQRFIAQQVGTIFNYEFNSFSMIELEANYIFVGDYIEEVRPGAKNLFHTVLTTELRF